VNLQISPGNPTVLGASWQGDRVNIAVVAPNSPKCTVNIYKWGEAKPFCEAELNPREHRTGTIWHCSFTPPELPLEYAFCLNKKQPLVGDPYAKCLGSRRQWRKAAGAHEDFSRGVILAQNDFDWQGVSSPAHPRSDLIIYEAHVRAFTMHDGANKHPGTYLGMIERLDYLAAMGITALELMPLVEFDELEYKHKDPTSGADLCQFWGYSPRSFFAPMRRYCARPEQAEAPVEELKMLVREAHRRGISVILDLVYNHSAWPNQSWARLAPKHYYVLSEHGVHTNFSGCGNTISANDVLMRAMIIESLRYFVSEYHIDGFRFDLTACLWRDARGHLMERPPVIDGISQDPMLQGSHLIAEPWDAGGAYQVGRSYNSRWMQWNGSFRDVCRRYLKGDRHQAGVFAGRMCGSQDLFQPYGQPKEATPLQSVNFLTCHDGFSLADLVRYNEKHNEANGEGNLDGCNHNESWNCGAEGESDDASIRELRERQITKALMMTLLAQGVPMLLMGDEVGLTRDGNNNTWCQDNELSAMPWSHVDEKAFPLDVVKTLIELRKQHPQLCCEHFITDAQIAFHGVEPNQPDWSDESALVCMELKGPHGHILVAFSRVSWPLEMALPTPPAGSEWSPLLETSLPLPPYGYGLWLAHSPA